MPTTRSDLDLQVVDTVLTTVARQYKPKGRIYDLLAPRISVDTISGKYPVFDERYWFGNDTDNKLTDRQATPEVDFSWSTESYLCEDYGLKTSITKRERQQAHKALRLEIGKTNFLMNQMANRREKRMAALLRKTTNGGGLNLGAAATTAFLTSTVIEGDWATAQKAIYDQTGETANVAVIPWAKAYDMALNPTLRDIFKYQVNAENFISIGRDGDGEAILLPRVFHGTRLIVPKGAVQQSGHEGAAKSLTDVWGTSVRFLNVDPSAEWGEPSTVYQFQHPVLTADQAAASDPNGAVIDKWHENDPPVDYVRATECVDEKIVAPDLGYEMTGV